MIFLLIALRLLLSRPLVPPPYIEPDPGPEWVDDVNRPKPEVDEMTATEAGERTEAAGSDFAFFFETAQQENVLANDAGMLLALWMAAGWRCSFDLLPGGWLEIHLFTRRT